MPADPKVKQRRRPRRTRGPLDRAASEAWHRKVVAHGCLVCPPRGESCRGRVQGHHAISQQAIRRYVSAVAHERFLTDEQAQEMERDLLWDPDNGIALCELAHTGFHARTRPIGFDLLPFPAVAFAAKIGLGWMLERDYPT